MQLTPNTTLERGKYRIIETLGRGGFGITYLAEQVSLHRQVCIKEFFPKDYYKREGDTGALTLSSDGFAESMNKFKAKFVKEAQTIATLNHPNIIPIHDVFEENGTAYYVMDYIEGESLSDIVKRSGAMSEGDAMVYIKQVASALAHIHEQQIMHLDIKPGNIMVRSKENQAILIDFGLSKHYDSASGEATSTTPVGVSHGFAPIEQYKQGGVSRFSPETDIYSLGATLYYLVTGNIPPQAADIPEEGILFPAHISPNIREAIERSMHYLRKDRPHTIKEFLTILDSDMSAVVVLDADDEKTKITPLPQVQTSKEQPRPKAKTSKSLEQVLDKISDNTSVDISQLHALLGKAKFDFSNIIIGIVGVIVACTFIFTTYEMQADMSQWYNTTVYDIDDDTFDSNIGSYIFLYSSLAALFVAAVRKSNPLIILFAIVTLISTVMMPDVDDIKKELLPSMTMYDTISTREIFDNRETLLNIVIPLSLIGVAIMATFNMIRTSIRNISIGDTARTFGDTMVVLMVAIAALLLYSRPWVEPESMTFNAHHITCYMSYSIMDTLGVMLAVFAIASLVIKNYMGVMVSSLLCAITVILSITMVDLHTMPHFEVIEAYGLDVSGIELEPTNQTIAAIVLLVVAFGVAAFLQSKSRKQSEDNHYTALTILGCIAIPIVWLTSIRCVIPSLSEAKTLEVVGSEDVYYQSESLCSVYDNISIFLGIAVFAALLLAMCRRWGFAALFSATALALTAYRFISADEVTVPWVMYAIMALLLLFTIISTLYRNLYRRDTDWSTIGVVPMAIFVATIASIIRYNGHSLFTEAAGLLVGLTFIALLMLLWSTNRHSVWTIILALIIGLIYINAENFFEVFYENLYGYSEMGDEEIAQIEHHDKLISALKWSCWGIIITSIAIPVGRFIQNKMKKE